MTDERRRKRNAVRLIRAIQACGGRFVLVCWQQYAVLGMRLAPSSCRRLRELDHVILELLQESALRTLAQGQIFPAVVKREARDERPVLVN